jgi:hypothetical protein
MKGRLTMIGKNTTVQTFGLVLVLLFGSVMVPQVAVAQDLRCGSWDVLVGGVVGPGALVTNVGPQGNLTGTFFGDSIQGFYNRDSAEMMFVRQIFGSTDPALTQVFTGYYWQTNTGTDQFDELAGFLEYFAGAAGGTAVRHRQGWVASCTIIGSPNGPSPETSSVQR